MSEGADFGFVGGAYEAPMLLQDAQKLINWFVELDNNPKAKMPAALLGAPGLQSLLNFSVLSGDIALPQDGGVRGAWVLPGNRQCIFVSGSSVVIATVTVPATQTSIAQFSTAFIGTLLTNNGRVCIRDNGVIFGGAGGYVVLVDGQYGYYYRMGGSGTITFTGTPTNGSATLAITGAVNPYLIAGSPIAGTGIPGGTTILSIDFNANTITMSAAATASPGAETITVTALGFGRITDPAFLPADRIAFIEGWLIFNQTGTRTFFTNAPVPYTLAFAGSFYALKDSSTDNLVTLHENNREAWFIGERTSEVWFNSGGANFAFSRLPGIGPQMGCSAMHSICRVGPNLCWLARNEQGENIVVMTNQYSVARISTHAIDKAIGSYPQISDAIGDCYEELGHVMYVLTFPTADVTWVFDLTLFEASQGRLGWWQRLSWNSASGTYHRHIGNCYVNFANVRMWGDFATGLVYLQSRSVYTDNGAPLRCQRRTPHVWQPESRQRIFQASLQIEFTPGVGLQSGQGSDPQVMVRWSNDGAQSWEGEVWSGIGKVGETLNRAMFFQVGESRDRVWEANFSDPTPRDIVGATLIGEPEEAT